MTVGFDEMRESGDAVREHYRCYDTWLSEQPPRGAAIVASPACGAWQWPADGPPAGRCERDTGRRYWHHTELAEGD